MRSSPSIPNEAVVAIRRALEVVNKNLRSRGRRLSRREGDVSCLALSSTGEWLRDGAVGFDVAGIILGTPAISVEYRAVVQEDSSRNWTPRSLEQVCPVCVGVGNAIGEACFLCAGTGWVLARESL